MNKRPFLPLLAALLLAALFACRSSPSDEITPLYREPIVQEFPFEESAENEAEIVSPDDSPQEPLVEEPLAQEPLAEEPIEEEPSAPESPPEDIESEEPLPEEIPVEEEQETLESLRETVEALRETVEALREALEALRETAPSEPPVPPLPPEPPVPPAPEQPPPAPEPTLPPAPEPQPPEPAPPPVVPPPPAPEPVQEPPPQVQPTPEPEPEPPPAQPIPEPPAQEPLPPETTPPPPVSEPPSFLGPAEPLYPPLVREPVPTAPPPEPPEPPGRVTPETPEEEVVFSRVVRVTVGQILEIPFRGTGWVYLGELGNRRGISYESRRLDLQLGSRTGQETVEGQSFIFSVDVAGTYILRFYRQDFIQDYIINDYVQVIAGERDENSWRIGDRVIAEPRWPAAGAAQAPVMETERPVSPAAPPVTQVIPPVTATQPAPEASPAVIAPVEPPEASPSAVPPATAPPPPATPPVESPAEYVRRARAEFDAGRIEPALGILDSFRQNYPGGTDDAWWLYGQLLEANSPSRDIRMSLEYYRRLVNEFPFSDLVENARSRIAYLERFYFNIR